MNFLAPAMSAIKPRLDDSGMDRLNYYYSSMVIMFCSLTITAKQYVGAPLQCWVPAQFTHAWEQYAENYCFVYNTYWVKPGEDVPGSVETRIAQQLIYYQWVPFIMGLEAAFFYFPAIFWGQASNKSGLNIVNLVETAIKADQDDEEARRKKVTIICGHIQDSIKLQNTRSEGKGFVERLLRFGLLDGSYIANVYTMTKVLYVVNLVGQFLMMNKFLGQNDPWWGAHILSDIMTGTDWELSGNFPRIAMCDFQVRVLGNLQRYSIQCVLSLNMFNEKIFLFLYWWFVLVGIFTTIDLISMIRESRTHPKKMEYIQKFIKTEYSEEGVLVDFCRRSVNSDVIIVLKFIGAHATEIITTDIIEQLWAEHKQRKDCLPLDMLLNNGEKESNGSILSARSPETTPLVEEHSKYI